MKLTRQQILLALLGVIAVVQAGDWILNHLIQGPLQARRARTEQLQKDIAKKEKLLAETRTGAKQLATWQVQSLPADPEVARTVYRSWLLSVVRSSRMRNAVVDSGSPAARRAKDGTMLYRTMPFSVRCRGALGEFNDFLFQFSRAGHLHQISSMSLNPVGVTGQFEISLGVDTLLLADRKSDKLNTAPSRLPALPSLADYSNIVKDNIFGVGMNSTDPMKLTRVSAITFSNSVPSVWITEDVSGRTLQIGLNEEFTTVALTGRIIEVRDQEAVIETAGERLQCAIGKPFSEATVVTVSTDVLPTGGLGQTK